MNFGSIVRLSHLIFSAMALTSKNVHSVNAEQMKGKVLLKLPHCELEAVKISAQLPALRALSIAAQTFPGKSFFWADVVFCHGTYALTEILLLLAWALQNSQQAIWVVRQEILVMLTKSQFPL